MHWESEKKTCEKKLRPISNCCDERFFLVVGQNKPGFKKTGDERIFWESDKKTAQTKKSGVKKPCEKTGCYFHVGDVQNFGQKHLKLL